MLRAVRSSVGPSMTRRRLMRTQCCEVLLPVAVTLPVPVSLKSTTVVLAPFMS